MYTECKIENCLCRDRVLNKNNHPDSLSCNECTFSVENNSCKECGCYKNEKLNNTLIEKSRKLNEAINEFKKDLMKSFIVKKILIPICDFL